MASFCVSHVSLSRTTRHDEKGLCCPTPQRTYTSGLWVVNLLKHLEHARDLLGRYNGISNPELEAYWGS